MTTPKVKQYTEIEIDKKITLLNSDIATRCSYYTHTCSSLVTTLNGPVLASLSKERLVILLNPLIDLIICKLVKLDTSYCQRQIPVNLIHKTLSWLFELCEISFDSLLLIINST